MTENDEKVLGAIYEIIDCNVRDVSPYYDALDVIRNIGDECKTVQVDMTHFLQEKIRNAVLKAEDNWFVEQLMEVRGKALLYTAPECFDDFIQYMELDRPFEKQFYLPRRKQLKPLADAMERLERRELELLAISLPPGVGKSTLAEFFLAWTGGRHPELPILTGSHSNSFLRGMYGEMLRFLDPNGDYKWSDVFPSVRVISTNAQDMMIDLGFTAKDGKRFATYEFSSIGSGNAGKVRAGNLLYCDDLVSSLEEALSRERMDKLYQTYATDLRQRKIGNCVELHISTRWSVHDVVGRLQQMNEDNPRAEFIVRPALNEDDVSNFDYPIPQGFTTKFYHDQREAMDDASWNALYMNTPYEREGQLYAEDELRKYFDLPEEQPDAIIACTDTKDSGKDFCCMLIAYQYGMDFYIEDLVYENFAPQIIDEQLVMKLGKHNVQLCQFESNAAGGRTADKVQERLKQQGKRTRITKKWTSANKDTKIIVHSPFVKEHFLFKDRSKQDKEYRSFMNALCSYTMAGRNAHDDAPDCAAQLSDFVQNSMMGRAEVFKRPW